MASRGSLNKVLIIGNLTRDPELRYTPSGAAVCTFGLATNRVYTSSDGTKKEEAEFHRIVSWNKLAELCSQLLTKGRKVFVEGRLQTRNWTTPAGEQRQTTEIVIDDMKILDKRPEEVTGEIPAELPVSEPGALEAQAAESASSEDKSGKAAKKTSESKEESTGKASKKKTSKSAKTKASDKNQAGEQAGSEESTEDLIKDLPF